MNEELMSFKDLRIRDENLIGHAIAGSIFLDQLDRLEGGEKLDLKTDKLKEVLSVTEFYLQLASDAGDTFMCTVLDVNIGYIKKTIEILKSQ